MRARFFGFQVQSLSARGLEARRGSGLRAWAGSPKEAQRRSRSGWGGVWAIFLVPDAFFEAAVRRPFWWLDLAALATAGSDGGWEAAAGVSGGARRVRGGSEWIFLVLAFLGKRTAYSTALASGPS